MVDSIKNIEEYVYYVPFNKLVTRAGERIFLIEIRGTE